jgi:hypothetical protein
MVNSFSVRFCSTLWSKISNTLKRLDSGPVMSSDTAMCADFYRQLVEVVGARRKVLLVLVLLGEGTLSEATSFLTTREAPLSARNG